MKATRVLETCLYAEDLDAAEQFYCQVLGLEAFGRVDGRHVFFRCGRSMFLVFNPACTAAEDHLAHGAVGAGHVAFHMVPEEIDDWKSQLQSNGVQIESERQWPGGGVSLYFRDPARNSLELVTANIWGLDQRHS